jgi:hypothetical protein
LFAIVVAGIIGLPIKSEYAPVFAILCKFIFEVKDSAVVGTVRLLLLFVFRVPTFGTLSVKAIVFSPSLNSTFGSIAVPAPA